MNVSIAYAKPLAQIWKTLSVAENATVGDVIAASGLLEQFPEIDIDTAKVGVFGTIARLDKPVKDGDRVEIYRPIRPDAELLEKRS